MGVLFLIYLKQKNIKVKELIIEPGKAMSFSKALKKEMKYGL